MCLNNIENIKSISIQDWMVNKLNLSGNDLLCYAIIYQLSKENNGVFDNSLQYLANWCNASKRGIQKNLNNLIRKGYIYKNDYYENNIKYCKYYIKSLNENDIAQKTKRTKNNGYIYMLKCANKVKIGYSVDVEQRIQTLDTRPFELELVFKYYSEKAYQIEQQIHKRLKDYKLKGEWYSNEITEDLIKNMIKNIIYELDITK